MATRETPDQRWGMQRSPRPSAQAAYIGSSNRVARCPHVHFYLRTPPVTHVYAQASTDPARVNVYVEHSVRLGAHPAMAPRTEKERSAALGSTEDSQKLYRHCVRGVYVTHDAVEPAVAVKTAEPLSRLRLRIHHIGAVLGYHASVERSTAPGDRHSVPPV
ncbi:hypothetical protein JB92DRAFT_2835260 [Gautieria morchelliformis]|nr:hypothetical protein JB92DRAFT_2835260 [Gautieria morchelliformis]